MANRHLEIVRRKLSAYAQRRVIRGLRERPARGGKTEFTFTWLHDKPFMVVFDDKAGTLTLKNALPQLPTTSHIYRDVRTLVQGRADTDLSAHRRIDPKRAELSCSNRNSTVSFKLVVKRNQYAYGIARLLNFANELFGHLDMYHIQYLWEHFDVPEE